MSSMDFEAQFMGSTMASNNFEASYKELFRIGAAVRGQLGEYGYLVDAFIGQCFEAMRVRSLEHICADGADAGARCVTASPSPRLSTKQYKESATKEYMNASLGFYEHMRKAVISYEDEYRHDIFSIVDSIDIQQLYEGICVRLGERVDMDALIKSMETCFLIITPMQLYWQAASMQLLDILRHRDRETGRCIYQLIMDD